MRRISRIDLTKSAFQRTLCSNPLNSEFDHYAVFELPAPESSISDQDAYFYIENRLQNFQADRITFILAPKLWSQVPISL